MPTSAVQLAATFDMSPLQPFLRDGSQKYGFAEEVKVTPPNELTKYTLVSPVDSENVIGTVVAVRLEDWLRDSAQQGRTLTDVTARQILRSHLDEFLSQLALLALRGRPVWLLICPSMGWAATQTKLATLCRTMTNLFAVRARNISQVTVFNWPASLLSEDVLDREGDSSKHIPFTLSGWEQLGESLASQISDWLRNQNPEATAASTQGSSELAAFLEGLRVQVELRPAEQSDIKDVDRILRTAASFSLAGERPTIPESEVEETVTSGNCYVVQVSDRLSDYGRSGVIVASPTNDSLVVSIFSLSCTVLGKQVEYALLTGLAQLARNAHLQNVAFEYRPSGRNQPTLSFLKAIGARQTDNSHDLRIADVEEKVRQTAVAPGAWTLNIPVAQ